jgi:hypothetical protein
MQIQQERERRNVNTTGTQTQKCKYNRNANAEMQIQQELERRNVKYNKNANAEMQNIVGIQAQQEYKRSKNAGETLQKKHKHGRSARTQQDAARRVKTATDLESSDK